MPVITMSRQVGSGAEEVASRLARDLSLIMFDKRLMMEVAAESGHSESEIVDYSEDRYELRGFFDALFRRARPVASVSSWSGGRLEGYERQVHVLDEERAVDLIRATMTAAYERGNVLIIGRGGQAILEGHKDVFHVRVVAPFEDRVSLLQGEQGLTAAQARRLIDERDRATAEYLHTFHNVDVNDPTLYHLVVNTGALGIGRVVSTIKAALQQVMTATS